MNTNILTKSCKCADCDEPMLVGGAFRWVKKMRPVAVCGKGMQGIHYVPVSRPAHIGQCLIKKLRQGSLAVNEENRALLLEIATPDMVDAVNAIYDRKRDEINRIHDEMEAQAAK